MKKVRGRFEKLFIRTGLWLVIALLLLGAVFMAGTVWEVYQKERAARVQRDEAALRHRELSERKTALEASVTALNTERGIEEEIRDRFPLAKEGEEVIVLVDAPEPAVDTEGQARKSMWDTILGWFR